MKPFAMSHQETFGSSCAIYSSATPVTHPGLRLGTLLAEVRNKLRHLVNLFEAVPRVPLCLMSWIMTLADLLCSYQKFKTAEESGQPPFLSSE